jgi:predicted RNA-binding protein associated with RNAse of E/G family
MEMKEVEPMRYVMVDLLLDLIIYPDGRYHLIDVDEFADSVDNGHLRKRQQVHALRTLDVMLQLQTKRRLIPRYVEEANMVPMAPKPFVRK